MHIYTKIIVYWYVVFINIIILYPKLIKMCLQIQYDVTISDSVWEAELEEEIDGEEKIQTVTIDSL